MRKLTVSRPVTMPDIPRIARYEKAPEFGPKVLFFSGGTALNETSRVLKNFTHNSIHLVTPFDSGGSSAVLRKAFDMPAIGDMRSRLMALADETLRGHPEIFNLFAHRLPKDTKQKDLFIQLENLANGKDERINAISNPMRRLIRTHLRMFMDAMPADFDLKGASIGNLILAAGYLNNNHQIDPVIFMFSKLVNVCGHVSPIVNDTLQLAAKLENGDTIIGQHLLTGKETAPLTSPITDLFLCKSHKSTEPTSCQITKKKRNLIKSAEIICYPPGSFYSSLAANLLPKGVGQAIAETPCPKVYFPSLGHDPERLGLDLGQSIFKLLDILKKDASNADTQALLNFVFIDSANGEKVTSAQKKALNKEGINLIDTRLISPQSAPYYDPQLLVTSLLSLT